MSSFEKMHKIADLLLAQKKYVEAFTIYDELYRQIWGIFGKVQCGIPGYAYHTRSRYGDLHSSLRVQFPEPAANALCLQFLRINLHTVIAEFIQVMRSRLVCMNLSLALRKDVVPDIVLNEFAVLYTLSLQPCQAPKLLPLFSFATASVDKNNSVRRLQWNNSPRTIEQLLLENARKCKNGKLNSLNHLLLDFLMVNGKRQSSLFKNLSTIVGPYAFKYQDPGQHFRQDSYRTRYKQYHQQSSSSSRTFTSSTASEDEKKAYYGRVIGLTGKVTKEQIRAKYIHQVSLYHPDKVQHLGPELKALAESKTKELNTAYDWLKTKYRI